MRMYLYPHRTWSTLSTCQCSLSRWPTNFALLSLECLTSILVSGKRGRRMCVSLNLCLILMSAHRIVIPFKYYPRTRAHRPILRLPTFFSSVKTSPEEWYQAVTCLKTKPNVKVDPIYCHVSFCIAVWGGPWISQSVYSCSSPQAESMECTTSFPFMSNYQPIPAF